MIEIEKNTYINKDKIVSFTWYYKESKPQKIIYTVVRAYGVNNRKQCIKNIRKKLRFKKVDRRILFKIVRTKYFSKIVLSAKPEKWVIYLALENGLQVSYDFNDRNKFEHVLKQLTK